ncbi:Histidine-specific methyltransferase, SAM-dependent [Ceratobasidium sp. AG-Ba]|nr:Histidine-specific methyltransferase, SAM-dependent [Ceratobasidium sp. AG-Ba]
MEPLILDVRESNFKDAGSPGIVDAIVSGLSKAKGSRSLPTLLLYDERGLRLYDDITTKAPEYYLFACEEQILKDHADEIVKAMGAAKRDGEVVIELGAGALRKTSLFLLALARAAKVAAPGRKPSVSYFALDLERAELVRTLHELSTSIGSELADRVSFGGMWGTYDGGIAFVKRGGLEELEITQTVTSKLDGLDVERGRSDERAPAVRKTQPTPTPSESDSTPSSGANGLAAPAAPVATGSAAQTPTRSALPTPPSSLPSPSPTESGANPIQLLFLGSSIGNFTPKEAAHFLRSLPLRAGSGDTLLLGLDQKNSPDLIRLAYDDPQGHTKAFALNGLEHASKVTEGLIDTTKWSYVEKYNQELGRHEGYYRSNTKQTITLPPSDSHPNGEIIELDEGELVNFEYSYKYSDEDAIALFAAADLRIMRRWRDSKGLYSLWLLERAPFTFPTPSLTQTSTTSSIPTSVSSTSSPSKTPFAAVPTRGEWAEVWKTWDTITLGMIPSEMLHQKPIDLRHKCLFYLGHIPAFLDIHLTRLLGEEHTEPVYFKDIFERGIDPHVDDPTSIHPHSEVPVNDEDWPSLAEILAFRDRVRARVLRLYDAFDSGEKPLTRKAGRVLWMTLEHETSHAEASDFSCSSDLKLIKRAGTGTLPPPTITPDWDTLAIVWDKEVSATAGAIATVRIGPSEVTIGHNDYESEDLTVPDGWQESYEFGWDNEHPQRTVTIGAVDVSTRPITNGDYLAYLTSIDQTEKIPKSWVRIDGETLVRTLYGPIKFEAAKHWPLVGSYDEVAAYAHAKGGRLPTEPELLAFRDTCDDSCGIKGNVGFRNWHYVPPHPSTHEERGHNGGIWEWTSTLMHAYEGYRPSVLYPGYSSDFHDEKHHVVLGGSFVTVPRIAMRRSYVNFYQHNYPYAWIGGRVCFDVKN